MEENIQINNMKIHPLLERLISMYPESKDSYLNLFADDSPSGFLESITSILIEENKFNVAVWANFLNEIYSPGSEDLYNDSNNPLWKIYKGIDYSLETLAMEKRYSDYLKENLRSELVKIYEKWEERNKD
jgi:hypothetical protein